MKINALIVDDDQGSIDVLTRHLTSFPFIRVMDIVHSGKDAIAFLQENEVDLLLLDIEMEGMTGIELANHVQPLYPSTSIVFITGHAGFALEGYESHPVDFLTKPIDFQRLEIALNRVKKIKQPSMSSEKEQKIGMKTTSGIQIISINDILYIEKKGRVISILCRNNHSVISSDTMKNLEVIFAPFEFYRSHQSFLVPIRQIKSIYPDPFSRSYSIDLIDSDSKIPLSRNRHSELKGLLEKKGIPIY